MSPRTTAPTTANGPPATVESLEPRRLLSAVLLADLDGQGVRDDALFWETGGPTRITLDAASDAAGPGAVEPVSFVGWAMDPRAWSVAVEPASDEGQGVRDAVMFTNEAGERWRWSIAGTPGAYGLAIEAAGLAPEPDPDPDPDPDVEPNPDPDPDPDPPGGPDFDADGRVDRFEHDADGATRFVFADGTFRAGWAMDPSAWSVTLADLDGDGRDDLRWIDAEAGTRIDWLMRPGRFDADFGVWTPDGAPGDGDPDPEPEPDPETETRLDPAAAPGRPGPEYAFMAQGDFDGDGNARDAVWRHGDGSIRITFSPGGDPDAPTAGTLAAWDMGIDWRALVLDLNADAIDDVLWVTEDGRALAWLMDRDGFRPDYAPVVPAGVFPEAGPPDPNDPVRSLFYVGHSLIGLRVPAYARAFAAANGFGVDTARYQLNWYSPLSVNWHYRDTKPFPSAGTDARSTLAETPHDVLVLAPGTPVMRSIEHDDTLGYALEFARLAGDTNPDTRVLLYQHWPNLAQDASGAWAFAADTSLPVADNWADQIRVEHAAITDIADAMTAELSLAHPDAPPVEVVPAGLALLELDERLADGRLDTGGLFASASDLFTDTLHLDDVGMALAAATVHATVYGDDPVDGVDGPLAGGLAGDMPLPELPADLAASLYGIAWDVVDPTPRI